MIVKAEIIDSNKLTELAIASKSYWRYSKELINSWKDDLKVTSKMIEDLTVFNFILDEKIVGFYILNHPIGKNIELEFLFVDPKFIGKGCTKALEEECISMTVLSDPNAINFYKNQGFIEIGKKESNIPNRFLPILKKNLIKV